MEWTLTHPTDPGIIARYGHDPRRGGFFLQIVDNGLKLLSYEAPVGAEAVRAILDDLVVIGLLGGADVELALEWLSAPRHLRGRRPSGEGVAEVLKLVERLELAAG